jgi:proteasome lid subunit RPN8/RPN11
LEISATARAKMVAHARAEAPAECCGVLLGGGDAVVDALPARNVAETPATRYLLDPQDHFNAIREARRRGVQVVGFYHSHPRSAAEPSPTDKAEANFPGYVYVIVSLADSQPDVRAFALEGADWRPLVIPA